MNCARFWKGILIRRLGNPMLPAQDLLVPKAVWDREEAVKEEEFRLDPAEPRLLVSLNTGLEDYPEDPVEEDPWRVLAWSMAASPCTHSLIIRGTDRDLQIAADLVAVLDLEKDKPVPKVESLRAFNLRHARAKDIADVLRNLNLNAAFAFPPKSNLVIVIGSEAEMKEIGEVIDALDVEVKP